MRGKSSGLAVLVAAGMALLVSRAPVMAQYLGGGTKTAHEARVADLEEVRDKFVQLGGAFPEDAYDWRPMDGVRSVRDVLALIGAETVLFPTPWGYAAPAWVPEPDIGSELRRLSDLPPSELTREVERGFDHVIALAEGMDAEALARTVPFFGLEVPLGTALTLMANDMHEHLGQLIAYARVNRVVPPWSRREDDGSGESEGGDAAAPAPGDILVADIQRSEVAWFDGTSGAYRGAFVEAGAGGLQGATGLAFGPDGHLYVASSQTHRILRYDGRTGRFLGTFAEGGELESPFSLIFGPDGDLYVSSGTGDRVLRYDGRTGDFAGVAARGGGLGQPIGLAFGPHDGILYVVNSRGRNVLRFDPAAGEPLGAFASDSLRFASDARFGPDGDLYVTSAKSGAVVRFDGKTGEFVRVHARLPGEGGAPMGLAFLPDGSLVVGDFGRGRLYRVPAGGGDPTLLSDEGLARPENVTVVVASGGG